jgi:hypothetical protein
MNPLPTRKFLEIIDYCGTGGDGLGHGEVKGL